MRRILILFSALVSSAQVLATDPTPEVVLSRIDCGRFEQFDMAHYDDSVFDEGAHRDAVVGCYVIRHGSQFMLWDVGIPVGLSLNAGGATWRVNGPQNSEKFEGSSSFINAETSDFYRQNVSKKVSEQRAPLKLGPWRKRTHIENPKRVSVHSAVSFSEHRIMPH